jgi:hypothetical protein
MAKASDSAASQPTVESSFRLQKYRVSAGAQPKLMKSASESSSAPKGEAPLSMRAMRPSSPSSMAAAAIASTEWSNGHRRHSGSR